MCVFINTHQRKFEMCCGWRTPNIHSTSEITSTHSKLNMRNIQRVGAPVTRDEQPPITRRPRATTVTNRRAVVGRRAVDSGGMAGQHAARTHLRARNRGLRNSSMRPGVGRSWLPPTPSTSFSFDPTFAGTVSRRPSVRCEVIRMDRWQYIVGAT